MKSLALKTSLPFLMAFCMSACRLESPQSVRPEEAGLSSKHLRHVDSILAAALSREDFPGAVVLIGRKGKTVFRKAYGNCQWAPQRKAMEVDMLFDLASVTKPVATATSVMILVDEGKISLEEKVKDYVPEFRPYIDPSGRPADDARIWHLLTHTSGLPSYVEPGGQRAFRRTAFDKGARGLHCPPS